MKATRILVSIIVPVYNAEKFIVQTIESVLKQNIKDFELILVNDGSTDSSKSLCLYFLKQDFRVKFIDSPNRGVSHARNLGLDAAQGEYVYFLDADDTLASDFLKTCLGVVKKQKFDIIVVGEHYCRRIKHTPVLPTCAMMLKRDFLAKNHAIRFPEGIQPCEDGLLSHQLLSLTSHIGLNFHGKHYYRQHEDQNHVKINSNAWFVLHQVPSWLKILDDFYVKHGHYQQRSLSFAKFIKHELLELRYLAMELDGWQKSFLFNLVKKFYGEKIAPNLTEADVKKLGNLFLNFINLENHHLFDAYYFRYKRRKIIIGEFALFLVKLIPISSWRRTKRKQVYERLSL